MAQTKESWMILHPWREGKAFGAIVCDMPPETEEGFVWQDSRTAEAYGGLVILESCPERIRKMLIDAHNRSLLAAQTILAGLAADAANTAEAIARGLDILFADVEG